MGRGRRGSEPTKVGPVSDRPLGFATERPVRDRPYARTDIVTALANLNQSNYTFRPNSGGTLISAVATKAGIAARQTQMKKFT